MKKIAIVGSGPAGLYTADVLSRAIPTSRVDIFERLPVPFGLIRYGVAPDHQGTKNIANVLSRSMDRPNVQFFGGVNVGQDFSVEDLRLRYAAVVLATGMSKGRRLEGQGFDTPNNITAFDIARWYNGHPEAQPPSIAPERIRAICIIGNGNVSLDIARFFAKTTRDLSSTDIPQSVLDWHSRLRVERIEIVGRGSPAHTRFSKVELAELAELADFQLCPDIEVSQPSASIVANLDAFGLLRRIAEVPRDTRKLLRMRFNARPVLYRDGNLVLAVDKNDTVQADLVVHAIGQDSEPVGDFTIDKSLASPDKSAQSIANIYVTGWAAAPEQPALIPGQRAAAQKLAPAIIEQVAADRRVLDYDIRDMLRTRHPALHIVSWRDWQILNKVEIESGRAANRPRKKITTFNEIQRILGKF